MADYFSPTVVTPPIPLSAVTALELLVLEAVFDAEFDRVKKEIYLFSEIGPNDVILLECAELAAAIAESATATNSTANRYFAGTGQEAEVESDDPYIEIDMTAMSWERILQDIVSRSTDLDEIIITTSFTCSKMRPDGFGGAVTLITADNISGKSTTTMIEDLRAENAVARMGDPDIAASPDDRDELLPVPILAKLSAALCVWEAMLNFRIDHAGDLTTSSKIDAMVAVWEELGSIRMRTFAIEIAHLALDVMHDLREEVDANLWAFDFEFVPAVVENLDWSLDGPEREGEPEIFLAAVLDTLRRKQ